jgi:hypothetical protein
VSAKTKPELQALAVLKAAEEDRLHTYFVLSLLTEVGTEEARALRWDHVYLADPVCGGLAIGAG